MTISFLLMMMMMIVWASANKKREFLPKVYSEFLSLLEHLEDNNGVSEKDCRPCSW